MSRDGVEHYFALVIIQVVVEAFCELHRQHLVAESFRQRMAERFAGRLFNRRIASGLRPEFRLHVGQIGRRFQQHPLKARIGFSQVMVFRCCHDCFGQILIELNGVRQAACFLSNVSQMIGQSDWFGALVRDVLDKIPSLLPF